MFRYLLIIASVCFSLFSKQPSFASAELEIPLDLAWEVAFNIAADRSHYLKAVVTVMKSDLPADRAYCENFRAPTELRERLIKDFENTYHLWGLFERTLDYYKEPADRSAMLGLLLQEIARVSHLANCDWANVIVRAGYPIPSDAKLIDLMPPGPPLGNPQKINVQRKGGGIETYMIVPAMNIAVQYAYEEHIYWRQMLEVLERHAGEAVSDVDRKNPLGKGSNGVDIFFRFLAALEGIPSDEAAERSKRTIKDRINFVEQSVFLNPLERLPAASSSETEDSETAPSPERVELADDAEPAKAPEDESLAALPLPAEVPEPLGFTSPLTGLGIDPSTATDSSVAAASTLPRLRVVHVPGKLNPKGEREKARAEALKGSAAVTAAATAAPRAFLNTKHYKTLETVLNVITTREPPKWEAFTNMIKALGGTCDDSAGNGTTRFKIGSGSFTVHTTHTKGDRMNWPQIKNFAKAGLERIGITLETVALRTKGK